MESLMSFLVFALGQLAEHQDVIQYASGIGAALTAAFTGLRFLRASSQRQFNIQREPAARSLPTPPAAKNATSLDAAVADLKEMMRLEARRNLVYGFAQNLFFFIIGTVTSIILQGIT